MITERLEDLSAVGGEAVDGDVGDPGDEDKPGGLFLGNTLFAVQLGQQPTEHGSGDKAHQNRVGKSPVPGKLLHLVQPWVGNDVEIRQGAKEQTPCHTLPAKLFAQRHLATQSAEGRLGD